MEFDNQSQIRLYSLLQPLQNDCFQLAEDSRDTAGRAPALEICAAGGHFYLKALDFACLHSLPAFADSKTPLQDLEPELKLAGLEILLSGPLQQLGDLLGCSIRVVSYQPDFQASPAQPYWGFKLKLGDSLVPLRLFAQAQAAVQILLTLTEPFSARETAAAGDHLPLQLSVILGSMLLSQDELKALQAGDTLVPDECSLQLEAGALRARAELQDGAVRLREQFQSRSQGRATAAGSDITTPDARQLEVVFELERQDITREQLTALQPGSILPLNSQLKQVSLLHEGRKIAAGRLLKTGDAFAVQLTALCPD